MAVSLAKVRSELVAMLMSDRAAALRHRNPSAAISASTKIADLLLNRMAEIENERPVTRLEHVIVHQILCPHCKELGPITASPPPPEPLAARPAVHPSDWDEVEPDPATPVAAKPKPKPKPPKTIEVAKLPQSLRRRRDQTPVIRGLP